MIDAPVDTSAEETPASARNAVIRLQNMLHIVEQLGMRHLVKLKVRFATCPGYAPCPTPAHRLPRPAGQPLISTTACTYTSFCVGL